MLPFVNEGAPDDGWFADNLTHDIAIELSMLPGSSVIGRETAATYRGREVDPRQIAQDLGVRYVLAGSVQRNADKVRIRVRLLDGESGAQRWVERFDVARDALPGLVDKLAVRVSQVVNVQMHRSAGEAAARLSPELARADDLAMRGFGVWYGGVNADTAREALDLFEQAVAKDPRSVRGWGGVSLASGTMHGRRWGDPEASLRRFVQAAEQLERLDPGGMYTLMAQGGVAFFKGDIGGALANADRLVERFPGDATGYGSRGVFLVRMGRFEEALEATDKALAINPLHPQNDANKWRRSFILFALGRYPEAVDWARQATVANPKGLIAPPTLAAALVREGKTEEARQVFSTYLQGQPRFDEARVRQSIAGTDNPRFVAARQDLIDALREIGLR